MGVISSVLNGVKTVGNLVKSVAGGSALAGAIGQGAQMAFESNEARKQREWNEQMQQQQNEWNIQQWNRQNEYNSPLEQVQRIRDAGLNPLYYGLDGSSAGSLESAQALGYDRASLGSMANPIEAGLDASLAKANIALAEANKNKIESETDSTKLDNEFKVRTMEARVEGPQLANQQTKETLSKIANERDKIAAEIGKIAAETQNEAEKRYLIQAETDLKSMEARQIVELLPYNKLLIDAQTENQKASASLAFAHAAIQNGLLEKGFVDAQIAQFDAEITKLGVDTKNAENVAAINDFKQAVRTGKWSEVVNPEGRDTAIGRVIGNRISAIYASLSAVSEAVAGPIAGLVK